MHKMHNKQEKEPISSKGTEETISHITNELLKLLKVYSDYGAVQL